MYVQHRFRMLTFSFAEKLKREAHQTRIIKIKQQRTQEIQLRKKPKADGHHA